MSNQQIKILGVNVSNLNLGNVLEKVEKSLVNDQFPRTNFQLKTKKPLVIFTPNPEIAVYAQKDEKFKKIVNAAQINIPDGVGLIWASKVLGQPLKEKISGVDLMEKLVELARDKSLTVGLIGGREGVALKALECLRKKYPGLNGWAEEGPRIEDDYNNYNCYNFYNICKKIQETKASFLFVGLGCPKQEYFIEFLREQMTENRRQYSDDRKQKEKSVIPSSAIRFPSSVFRPPILMAVGGSFDYLSGQVKRAPLFIRKIGFEWVWRLLLQPWRLKRQLAILKFIRLVLKQKLKRENGKKMHAIA